MNSKNLLSKATKRKLKIKLFQFFQKAFKIIQIITLFLVIIYSVYLLNDHLNPEIIETRLYQTVEVPPQQNFFYLLDSGHGIRDDFSDKCGSNSVKDPDDEYDQCFMEYEFNWDVRSFLASMLDSMGIAFDYVNNDVFYYKNSPTLDLKSRVNFINTYEPQIDIPIVVISIHANASSNKEASGFEVYVPEQDFFSEKYFYPNKKEFSNRIASEMYNSYYEVFDHLHKYNHHNKPLEENFYILRYSKPYVILTENEYFTNPQVLKIMKTNKFKKKVATAHLLTILKLEELYCE